MLVTDYNGIGKIQYLLSQRNLAIDSSEYTDIVRLILTVPYEEKEEVCKELIESTSGKVKIEELEKFYFVSG